MSTQIRFTPDLGPMGGTLSEVPLFPGDAFLLNVPEALGDGAKACWFPQFTWTELSNGVWRSTGLVKREVDYQVLLTPGFDTVDLQLTATNISDRVWSTSFAFNCFNSFHAPSVNDFECVRIWSSDGAGFKRLVQLPRAWSVRPTIQAYSVLGGPAAAGIPFVAKFGATSSAALEGWLAIQSRDGARLVAVATKPASFLFQNMEYSCIHAASSFGPLAPGETGTSWTRLYFVQATLADWRTRLQSEMGI